MKKRPTPRSPSTLQVLSCSKIWLTLVNKIAKNVHDVWSLGRIKDGWTYGSERNDAEKKHPCLLPYEELPESEKEYERNTVQETLRLIMKLGFEIVY